MNSTSNGFWKIIVGFTCSLMYSGAFAQTLSDYIQPFAGTAAATTATALKHSSGTEANANTIPSVGRPFAMTQFTPQTRFTENKCVPPYFYKDTALSGFRASHWLNGSCTQDYGSVTIMPVTGSVQKVRADYAVAFAHQDERASAYAYRIQLPSSGIEAAIAATERCGIMQFTMLRDDSLHIMISPNSDKGKGFIKLDAVKGIAYGYNPAYRIYQGIGNPAGFSGHFYIEFEKKALKSGVFSGNALIESDSIKDCFFAGGYLSFYLKKGEQLRLRIGTSFSGLDGAKKNLKNEITTWDFQSYVRSGKAAWEKALHQIEVATKEESIKKVFYTSLYHAMQHPRLFSDVDGVYPKFAGSHDLKKMADGNYYDDFSMWDIYRAQLPLFEILQPRLINQFVNSLVLKGEQGGWLPIFPCWNSYTAAMIGDHVTAFIASAYQKNIRHFDLDKAYALMRKNAFVVAGEKDYRNGMGRRALPSYLQYGYIPMEDSVPIAFHKKEQVSRTLEYAFDDYALSLVAKGLHHQEDYQTLQKRSLNYQNIFDASVGMMRGRHADGRWATSFHADIRESYITEGTPRQYSFYVPQDIPGLIRLMGGKKAFENALDSLFQKNEYWHGNEPGHQIPFLYNYTDAPWKTQGIVQDILKDEYSDGPGGLGGNDDAGQMSAWYIFASMGFYPVDPVSTQYQLCAPIFDQVRINLSNGKKMTIHVHRQSVQSRYIAGMKLNGKSFTKFQIDHRLFVEGGQLEMMLTDQHP